jgi:hypothetical protein
MKYKSEEYRDQFKRSMRTDIYKEIGDKPIKEVNSADVLRILNKTMDRVKRLGITVQEKLLLAKIDDSLAWL